MFRNFADNLYGEKSKIHENELNHPIYDLYKTGINNSDINENLKKSVQKVLFSQLSKIPNSHLDQVNRKLSSGGGLKIYKSPSGISDFLDNNKRKKYAEGILENAKKQDETANYYGLFSPSDKSIHLSANDSSENYIGNRGLKWNHNHEFGHVVDFSGNHYLNEDWNKAWKKNIGDKAKSGYYPIGDYGSISPMEGFAEIYRLINDGHFDKMSELVPDAYDYFKHAVYGSQNEKY